MLSDHKHMCVIIVLFKQKQIKIVVAIIKVRCHWLPIKLVSSHMKDIGLLIYLNEIYIKSPK